jgi:DNA-binding GntR family transcriptional regulator
MKGSHRGGWLEQIAIERPKSLAALVAERLRQAIFNTEIKLGQVLSEEQIASTMNVSRTPVREALTMLQLQGLIDIRPQRGSVVFKPDASDIQALVRYRLTLETSAVPLALDYAPGPILRELTSAIEDMDRARDGDHTLDYARADARFHQSFFTHCGNHYFEEAYAMAAGRICALRAHLAGPLTVHRGRVHAEHVEIAEAFAARDLSRLNRTLTDHILAMTDNYVTALGELRMCS